MLDRTWEHISAAVEWAAAFVWNWPVVIAVLGAGVLFTALTRGVQFRAFGHAWAVVAGKYDNPDDPGHITHLQALSAAVSGTVGLGNIAGVAIAVAEGGPGALVWMWAVGLLGMAVKFAEVSLGTHYREQQPDGHYRGGAMYYITRGLPERFGWTKRSVKPLALLFAGLVTVSSFGGGNMFQSNNVATILFEYHTVPTWLTGLVLAICVALVIIGGIRRIGRVAGVLVPMMCTIYVLGAIGICVFNYDRLPSVLALIFEDALTGEAAAGGAIGVVITQGVRRAVFSSEAGLGTAPIAHASARTDVPLRQGVVALLEPFIDTILVCSATGIVLVMAGEYGVDSSQGVAITARAFGTFIPGFGAYFLAFAVALFAFSTAITWSYYGETAVDYLLGPGWVRPYKYLFVTVFFLGALPNLDVIKDFSDLFIGLIFVPNMITVVLLAGKLRELAEDYFARLKSGQFGRLAP